VKRGRFIGWGFALLFLLVGCEEEVCGTENCGGICYQGECLSEEAYVEALGADFFRDYYLGNWESGRICPQGSDVGNVEIIAGSAGNELQLTSFGPEQTAIQATFLGTSLIIPEQIYGSGTITGSGGIDTTARIITLDYAIDEGNGPFSCLTTLEAS